MMEIEQLRKADIFTGSLIIFLGIFIISLALQMPMKDSYGGVQNVWYVSPALFPLLIGSILVFLGLLLMKTAIKAVGLQGVLNVIGYLGSSDFISFIKHQDSLRFYGIVLNLIVLVFIMVPRVDFFLAAILFLLIFFLMFYCGSPEHLQGFLVQAVCGTLIMGLFTLTSLSQHLSSIIPYPNDWLILLLIVLLLYTAIRGTSGNSELRRKLKISIILALAAPLVIGGIFKYFLLVPMPFEGIVVFLLDTIWYAEFWP